MTGLKVYHTVLQTQQKAVQLCHQSRYGGKGMNDPHPGLEIVIHIQPGPVISTLSNPSARARERRVSSSVASVRDSVFFLLFFSDLRVGTKTPRRISATGCTVLLLFGVSVTSSPDDLSTSPNQFFDV